MASADQSMLLRSYWQTGNRVVEDDEGSITPWLSRSSHQVSMMSDVQRPGSCNMLRVPSEVTIWNTASIPCWIILSSKAVMEETTVLALGSFGMPKRRVGESRRPR